MTTAAPLRLAASAPRNPSGRLPPHDLDAEAAVLGALLLDALTLDEIQGALLPEHFYSDANGRIYEAALALRAVGSPVDIVTVAGWLRARECFAGVGGASYLALLADSIPVRAHVGAYAAAVTAKWRMRQFIAATGRMHAEAYGDVGEEQEFMDASEAAVGAIARPAGLAAEAVQMKFAVQATWAEIAANDERAASGLRPIGVSTPFADLNAMIGRLQPKEMTVIAARPGVGKTAMGVAIGLHVAAESTVRRAKQEAAGKEKEPLDHVLFFSAEMPQKLLTLRTICTEAGINVTRLRSDNGNLEPDDWRALQETSSWLSSLPFFTDDTRPLSPADMRARARRFKAKVEREGGRLALIVVDYLQNLDGHAYATKSATKEEITGACSKQVVAMADECDVPVIALAQLNRIASAPAGRGKDAEVPRPSITSLRESGQIEQDAATIVLLHREEYYHPEGCDEDVRGVVEIIVGKQRNGEMGLCRTRFDKRCGRFADDAA